MLNPNYTKEVISYEEALKYHFKEFDRLGRTLYYFMYSGVPYAIMDINGEAGLFEFPMSFEEEKNENKDAIDETE